MLYLCPAQINHAPKWFGLVEKDRVWLEASLPYLREIKTEKAATTYVRKNLGLNFYTGVQIYEIWQKNELVGLLTLHEADMGNRSVDIAYWVGKAYTRQGIATEACRFICSKIFINTIIKNIYIRCASDNKASQGVALKLGLDIESIVEDIYSYVMPKKKWMKFHYDEADLHHFIE